jgi:hypothetical protein
MKPRSDLDTMLDQLERDLPGMLDRAHASQPHVDQLHAGSRSDKLTFWREFSVCANEVRDAAGPHDLVHVDGRIQQMLASAGLAEEPNI